MKNEVTLKVKRFDTTLPLPTIQTAGSACFDLCARVDTTIPANEFGKIPLNVAIEAPAGFWIMLAVRGSTHKTGLLPANGIGIVDNDFCGDDNEYNLPVYNTKTEPVTITRGTRIAQATVLPDYTLKIEGVDRLTGPSRGSFGSTGTN